nr:peptidoglycan-binding domain-containing protein [Thiosulfatihalobacter marinus]
MTRGQVVRDLQNQLVELGYDVGSVDGVFGLATEAAILWVQYDNGLEQTGFVDRATAEVLGYDVPPAPPPTEGSDDGATGATTEEAPQTEDDPAVTGDAATDATAAPDATAETAGEDSGAETGSGSD